ncbi:hypothetical protein GCM10010512_39410 [Streptomyces thermoviolaceus subsp. thermoviolaceus]|nr:hypothetical protein GCM10010512_39410 [Streptomyces thermoviolaceus subsp. thermoviolaceus]
MSPVSCRKQAACVAAAVSGRSTPAMVSLMTPVLSLGPWEAPGRALPLSTVWPGGVPRHPAGPPRRTESRAGVCRQDAGRGG